MIGASGGVGRAIVTRLASCPTVASVHAFSRSALNWNSGVVTAGQIDLTDERSVNAAAEIASGDGELDLVIVATGILARDDGIRPEKTIRELDPAALAALFSINTIGPALVAKHFLPTLRKRSKTAFTAISARVGSIGDNRLGGWYSYRASKAALNMLLKTLSIEHARLWPDSVVAGLHPGTVDTSFSKPFTEHTPKDKLFTADQSAGYLLDVIDGLQPKDSGGVFAWDGSRVEN